MNYFIVKAKCGHVGRNSHIKISYAIIANTGVNAAKITRNLPRVKHHDKEAIIDVRQVEYDEYLKQRTINSKDPYLHCKNIQDQVNVFDDIRNRIECNGDKAYIQEEDYIINRYKRIQSLLKKRKQYDILSYSYSY